MIYNLSLLGIAVRDDNLTQFHLLFQETCSCRFNLKFDFFCQSSFKITTFLVLHFLMFQKMFQVAFANTSLRSFRFCTTERSE